MSKTWRLKEEEQPTRQSVIHLLSQPCVPARPQRHYMSIHFVWRLPLLTLRPQSFRLSFLKTPNQCPASPTKFEKNLGTVYAIRVFLIPR